MKLALRACGVLVVATLCGMAGRADAQLQAGVVRLTDGDIPYEIQGSGRPVVLIHGWAQNMRAWDEQMPAFSRVYRVMRYDIRGFGRSTGDADVTAAASDLAALLDSLRIPSAAILGLSMGARIALNFAVNYPQRVSALVLYGAPPTTDFPVASPEFMVMFQGFVQTAKTQGLDSLGKVVFASELAWSPQNRSDIAPKIVRAWEGFTARDLTHPMPPSNRVPVTRLNELKDLRMPVLVIHGDHELAWFRQFDDTVMARVPYAKRAVIANAGHLAHFAEPEQFNRAVLDFLRDASR